MKAFYPFLDNQAQYDPAEVQYSHQADYIYSTLERVFYLDRDHSLKSNCLESQSYEKGLWKLQFKNSLKTSQGNSWGAKDFYLSLMRLLILKKDLHHNISEVLNLNKGITSLEDRIETVSLKENALLFHVNPIQKEILEEMFTTHESSILYRESFDHQNLRISDYFNTTGQYYKLPGQAEVLIANENHERKNFSESIHLISLNTHHDPYRTFIDSDVDILKSINIINSSAVYQKARDNEAIDIYTTPCFDLITLKFNKNSDLPLDKRMALGRVFKNLYLDKFLMDDFNKQANQFFPDFSIFSLSDQKVERYQSLIKEAPLTKGEGIKFKVKSKAQQEFLEELAKKALPELTFTMKDDADVSLSSTDTGAHETYSPIIYFSSIGMFDLDVNKQDILARFSRSDREERQKIGQKVHEDALFKGQVFPILFSPRVSLAKKPYIFTNQPELVWNITKES